MATKQQDAKGAGSGQSGMDRLLDEVGGFLSAQAGQLADRAADKVDDLTDRLYDVAENGGSLAGVGSRILGGDSPMKAVIGQTFSGIKDKVTDAGAGLFGGGGDGDGGGDGGGGGKKRGRKSGNKAINIVETIDVGVPLRTAYDHWTQYEDFSSFAKGVRSVSQGDDTTTDWRVKVGPSTRTWKATVQEQVPDERIIWTSDGPKGTTRGCVSFHELAPALTRIVLVVEYYPSGFFERTGNLWRAQGRRMRLDLKHFSRFVTLSNDEPDGWRGEIRDGEVVVSHEEAVEEEERAAAEESGAEGEGEEDGQDEDYPEDEAEREDEPDGTGGEDEGADEGEDGGAYEDEDEGERDYDEDEGEDEGEAEGGRAEPAAEEPEAGGDEDEEEYEDEDEDEGGYEDEDEGGYEDEDEAPEDEDEPPRRRRRR
ncbi:SRPBCC family protein [Streptomyces sp. NRRL S-87]|uniref:SRPBCC family protein n=1 Tax=Streptomyces sp. NRRL S-87 TaxID=1463920 RepID=UPI0004C130FD|nr:SRPBCC family protein [Streptomyces sp. NRRL S-87]